jgi:phosphoribosylanthranilate isomerase
LFLSHAAYLPCMAHAQTKICGLKTPELVDVALDAGAAFLGFMTFPQSPRHLEPAQAGQLAALARGRARSVSVVVDPDDALIDAILSAVAPDFIQLHGHETLERCAAIRARGVGVIKAFGVSGTQDLQHAKSYEGACDYLLFDAKPPPDAARPGGLGAPFDWTILHSFASNAPWFLSGGLNPVNVADAVRISGAGFVDVSSGVESAPGLKDSGLMVRFLAALDTPTTTHMTKMSD